MGLGGRQSWGGLGSGGKAVWARRGRSCRPGVISRNGPKLADPVLGTGFVSETFMRRVQPTICPQFPQFYDLARSGRSDRVPALPACLAHRLWALCAKVAFGAVALWFGPRSGGLRSNTRGARHGSLCDCGPGGPGRSGADRGGADSRDRRRRRRRAGAAVGPAGRAWIVPVSTRRAQMDGNGSAPAQYRRLGRLWLR